jgi:MoxR-like ATPase
MDPDQEVANFQRLFAMAVEHIHKAIIGQAEAIEYSLIGLLAGGHVLLEGAPGLGKTRLVKTLSRLYNLKFSRIQCTPDLMPADIVGTNILLEDAHGKRGFSFQPGPIFGNVILTDEINRATPKTQSALLEAMEEHSVTVQGQRYPLPPPFFVMATQNPIEMEGVYALPEAQLDRFMFKIEVEAPPADVMRAIIDLPIAEPEVKPLFKHDDLVAAQRTLARVPVGNHLKDYVVRIYRATHPNAPEAPEVTKKYVRYGASPRGAQALLRAACAWALLGGRFNVSAADIQRCVIPVFRHRVIRNFEAEARGISSAQLIQEIVRSVSELPPR